jgi:hypothetical protein
MVGSISPRTYNIMIPMNRLVCSVLAAMAVSLVTASAAEAEWLTDLGKAKAKAKAENKVILMDFTGSNW